MPSEKITKCLKEGTQQGDRHQGLRKIEPNEKRMQEYLLKAQHNFGAMVHFHQFGYSDWSASAAFYTLYHCLLALLAQRGYESRNQSCTFALIEEWIEKNEIKLFSKTDVKEIFDKEIKSNLEYSTKILDIRERMQYGTKTSLAEAEFEFLKKRTKELFDKIKLEIERISEEKP